MKRQIKTITKLISIVFSAMILFYVFLSCNENSADAKDKNIPQNAIKVGGYSGDMYHIQGEYPVSMYGDPEAFKRGVNTYVSKNEMNDRLVISANRYEGVGDTLLQNRKIAFSSKTGMDAQKEFILEVRKC